MAQTKSGATARANEKRLIDANELIDWIDAGHLRSPLVKCFSEWDVVKILRNCPTVDAVEVVRCKDCKRYEENTEARTRFCRRELGYMYATPDGFCSYGERKDNAW